MTRKKRVFLFLLLVFFFACLSFPYSTFKELDNEMFVTRDEFENMLDGNFFLSPMVSSVATKEEKFEKYAVDYKLFNLFTIKKLKVNVVEKDRYFAGGNSLGFSLQSKGIILIGGNYIISNNGIERPFESSGLMAGDIITHIDGVEISTVSDIADILGSFEGGELILTVIRNGEKLQIAIKPAYDIQSNTYKLGLWVKEDAVGIGTLTFVNATTRRFGSLGHSINDSETNECIEVSGGNIYFSKILGVKKGFTGRAGELMGTFNREDVIGNVDKNCEYGVYGYMSDLDGVLENKTSIDIGGRLTAKPGKAKILSCIDGEKIEEFDIEIIKTNFQSSSNQKSMVIRVTDKDLISRTGGIVQGMSGSPIIQDGKLIGAVTHVFVNDATKGFGLYIDWMLDE